MDNSKEKLSKFLTELDAHYAREYNKLNPPPANLAPLLTPRQIAMSRIVIDAQIIKYSFAFSRVNTIASCFKITYEGTSSIYGYLYSEIDYAANAPTHKFICCSPTFKSQDGEYRHRLMSMEHFNGFFKRYEKLTEAVETLILRKFGARQFTFQVDFFYPRNFTYSQRKFEDEIDSMRVAIKILVVCWLCDAYKIINKTIENHINAAYQYIIFQPEDQSVYDKIVADVGGLQAYSDIIETLYGIAVESNGKPSHTIMTGQKIIPLTMYEATRVGDIMYSVWREIYCSALCSNLVLNFISPSFPLINNWLYIQNTHAAIFDNKAMHDKYEHSEIAEGITAQLQAIDKYNYLEHNPDKQPINSRFGFLSKSVRRSIVYSESAIRLTDLCLCATSEYVGRTLKDSAVIIANSPRFGGEKIGGLSAQTSFRGHAQYYPNVFGEYNSFAKLLFEYIYGCYCMNSRVGVIHTDLHMNNETIYPFLGTDIPGAHVAYCVDAATDTKSPQHTYIFKHTPVFGVLIDFSRALVVNTDKLTQEFGAEYVAKFEADQKYRTLGVMQRFFPRIVEKYKGAAEGLLSSHYELMFKILSVVDCISLCTGIVTLFNIEPLFRDGGIKIDKEGRALLDKCNKLAEAIGVELFTSVLSNPLNVTRDFEWPLLRILRECFGDFEFSAEKHRDIKIVDMYNYANEMKYDINDHGAWGPLLDISAENEMRKKYKLAEDEIIEKWQDYVKIDDKAQLAALIAKYSEDLSVDDRELEWMVLE